jgi:branched-chain amino acid transport system substrate-binding protein
LQDRSGTIIAGAISTTGAGSAELPQRRPIKIAAFGYRPKLLVGLTSSSTPETLKLCGTDAEGLLIPTSFIATTPRTIDEALAVSRCGGIADLHGMAAWEILDTVKRVIEQQGIVPTSESVQTDRRKLRDGLARLETMQGLLGVIRRRADRESLKPLVLAQVRKAQWQVVFTPPT